MGCKQASKFEPPWRLRSRLAWCRRADRRSGALIASGGATGHRARPPLSSPVPCALAAALSLSGRANLSASTLIPVRTGSSGWPLVPMAGPLRWAVDSAGGTKPAKPSGPGFLRGALPGRVLFPCWCGRSGGAPASASASITAADGPLARLTIERHPALGSAGQHALRWTFAVWVPFSPSPSTLS